MKVAIPLFGTRVAPRLDVAERFLVVFVEDDRATDRQMVVARSWRLLDLAPGVDALICGGVDRRSARQILDHDLRLFSWITGEAEDALSRFLRGELISGEIMEPGGQCCERWRLRGRCGGRDGSQAPWEAFSEGDSIMPGKDGTGPKGEGPGTGRRGGRQRPARQVEAPLDNRGAGSGPGQGKGAGAGQGRGAGRGQGKGRGGGRGGRR